MKQRRQVRLVKAVCVLSMFGLVAFQATATTDAKEKKGDTEVRETSNITWQFYSSINEETIKEAVSKHEDNPFSPNIGVLKQLFHSKVFKRDQISAGDMSAVLQIRKPKIYSSVCSIEKYYNKKRKKKQLNEQDCQDFEHVLRVAISTIDEPDTELFENHLAENKKKTEQQINLYKKVTLTKLY